MRHVLGAVLLTLVVSACGADTGDEAPDSVGQPSSTTSEPTSPPPPSQPVALPHDLTAATLDQKPCRHPRKVELDRALASGGVWMPTDDLARQDDLVAAWLCSPDLPALQWEDLAILFDPEVPRGAPQAYFQDSIDRLGRGEFSSALGGPVLVLDAQGRHPAEVDLLMGNTHIVLLGLGEDGVSADELLRVARSMTPLH